MKGSELATLADNLMSPHALLRPAEVAVEYVRKRGTKIKECVLTQDV
jgi:hypothetical protein